VLTYVCPDGQYDAAAGTCAAPVWVDQPPSFWAGATVDDVGTISADVLTFLAIAFVIWLVIRWAQTDV
jgi:hypothetical protein